MVKGGRPHASYMLEPFFTFYLTLTTHLLGQIAVCTEVYMANLKHLQAQDTKFMNILSLKKKQHSNVSFSEAFKNMCKP